MEDQQYTIEKSSLQGLTSDCTHTTKEIITILYSHAKKVSYICKKKMYITVGNCMNTKSKNKDLFSGRCTHSPALVHCLHPPDYLHAVVRLATDSRPHHSGYFLL